MIHFGKTCGRIFFLAASFLFVLAAVAQTTSIGNGIFARLTLTSNVVVAAGDFAPGEEWQTIAFDHPARGRFFCLDALSSFDGQPFAAVAELQLLDETGKAIDREGWKIAYADSEEHDREDGSAVNVLDDEAGTHWHTRWSSAPPGYPHHLILDLGQSQILTGFRYLPRQGGPQRSGRIKAFRASVAAMLQTEKPSSNLLPAEVYLFSYFTDYGEDGLHLAWSLDGYQWDELNGGRPMLSVGLGASNLLRDPCLLRGPDGTFHLVWTKFWIGNSIGYASSKDLIHWENEISIPVMSDIPGTRNCWAPEIYWDGQRQQFLIIWASAVDGRFTDTLGKTDEQSNQRIYYTTTKDFRTFTSTRLFFDPGTGIIDPTIASDGKKFYLFFKDETSHPPEKNIGMAVADDLLGPYKISGDAISPRSVEGPAVFPTDDGMICMFHFYTGGNTWGAVKSTDWQHWSDVSERLKLPPESHPGTILRVPREELISLWQAGYAEIGPSPETADLDIGQWIWTDSVRDKQSCRLWRRFEISAGTLVSRAILRITADNGYRLFLDGREIGRGGDLDELTEYDLTQLLKSGDHVLAVEGFNDAFAAGVILGLNVQLLNGQTLGIFSDPSWFVVPDDEKHWTTSHGPGENWKHARIVGFAGKFDWQRPKHLLVSPPLLPQQIKFWQQGWFLTAILIVAAMTILFSIRQGIKLAVQMRSQKLLDRERARIASDMHDDLGSGLTQLTLLGEVVLRQMPRESEARNRLAELCAKSRLLLRSMDEIIWVVNPRRDTVKDFAAFVSEHAQEYLASTAIHCRQEVAEELPSIPLDLPQRRNLLLAVKEAIRNAARHSGAQEINLKIGVAENVLKVVVEDDGKGFAPTDTQVRRNGMVNMKQRLTEIGGQFILDTARDKGCRITFLVPLTARENKKNS